MGYTQDYPMSKCRLSLFAASVALILSAFSAEADDLKTPEAVASFSASHYDAINSLKAICTSTSAAAMGGMSLPLQATARIEFQRPGAMRVDGTDTFNHTYGFAVAPGQAMLFTNGSWTKEASPDLALAAVTATAQGTATTVPALLLHTIWGYPFGPLGYTPNVGAEAIAGRKCYRIAKALAGMVEIFWIDKKTGLVVKEQAQATLGGIHVVTNRTYKYEAINRPIEPSVFVMPH